MASPPVESLGKGGGPGEEQPFFRRVFLPRLSPLSLLFLFRQRAAREEAPRVAEFHSGFVDEGNVIVVERADGHIIFFLRRGKVLMQFAVGYPKRGDDPEQQPYRKHAEKQLHIAGERASGHDAFL